MYYRFSLQNGGCGVGCGLADTLAYTKPGNGTGGAGGNKVGREAWNTTYGQGGNGSTGWVKIYRWF